MSDTSPSQEDFLKLCKRNVWLSRELGYAQGAMMAVIWVLERHDLGDDGQHVLRALRETLARTKENSK